MTSYQVGDVVVLHRRPYQLLGLMGRGGQGSVFEARDPDMRLVAIKMVPALPRHRNEARILAGLQTDHIVRLLDVGVSRNTLIMVMERLEGVDLRAIIEFCKAEGRSVPLRIVVDCLVQACMALVEAVQFGHLAFHRDIKPGNLVLERSGVLKLIDFGIAHRDDMVYTGSLIGTPENMAPEQVGLTPEWRVDVRTDLYCLGLVMYELLFLEALHAFPKGMPVPERLMKVWQGRVDVQVARTNALSRSVGAFLQHALQRDPAARFQTPKEMLTALIALRAELPESMDIRAFAACAIQVTRAGGEPEGLPQAFPLQHVVPTLSLELGSIGADVEVLEQSARITEAAGPIRRGTQAAGAPSAQRGGPAAPTGALQAPPPPLTLKRLGLLVALSLGIGLVASLLIWILAWLA